MIDDPSYTVLRALKYLEVNGSVSKTAAILGLTQSAVSRAIANYEKSIGLELLRRDTRPISLTEEGLLVANHALEIDRSVSTLLERLTAVRAKNSGTVRVGSFGPTASANILPKLLVRFARQYPNFSVSIQEGPDDVIRSDLIKGNLDMAILADPIDDFDAISVAEDRLVALVPKRSSLAEKPEINATDLTTDPFIMPLAGSEPSILDWFQKSNVEPNIKHRIQQTHSILALVRAELGNSIVTSLSLPKEIQGVRTKPLSLSFDREIFLAKKPSSPRSNAAAVFWAFAMQDVEQFL